ncbi:MAG TPA: hypothetical protein VLV54_09795 [Thermoanaerobaculia bacterium]|nr:hypothetical protein [Thermoanaerobaculia bacterium]
MNHSESDPPSFLRRRDFLALGSAGLLMPLFGNLAWAEPLASVAADAAVQTMSVGYLDGSEEIRDLKRLPRQIRRPAAAAEAEATDASPVIIPATSLFQADTSLPGQPLRIRVHGLYPPVAAVERKRQRDVPPAVDLEAIFPSSDPVFPAPLSFYVWSLRQRPGWNPSPPTSFRFPLDWQVLPEFVLRVRASNGTSKVLRTRFTLDNESGRPKLRRGLYVFGFDPRAWQSEIPLSDLARSAPAEIFSVLVSMESEPAPAA